MIWRHIIDDVIQPRYEQTFEKIKGMYVTVLTRLESGGDESLGDEWVSTSLEKIKSLDLRDLIWLYRRLV